MGNFTSQKSTISTPPILKFERRKRDILINRVKYFYRNLRGNLKMKILPKTGGKASIRQKTSETAGFRKSSIR
jgi:hypothetical protein